MSFNNSLILSYDDEISYDNKDYHSTFSSHRSIRLTQTILGGIYFLLYNMYENHFLSTHTEFNLCFILFSFILSLLLGDMELTNKVMPSIFMSAQIFPGSLECISLFLSISWMIHSLTWLPLFNQSDLPLISTNLLNLYFNKLVAIISVANWLSWTSSFIL